MRSLLLTASLLTLTVGSAADGPLPTLPPRPPSDLQWTNAFVPGITYRTTIPTGESVLGFPVGERPATAAQITECLQAWTNAAPDRCRLTEYARSHEGRPLHYLMLSAPENLQRLEEIQVGLARLADPRTLQSGEAARLAESLPAVAWLGYTIHGDETEGSDAALAVIYHLLAADDPKVEAWLRRLVVVIDPLMNPDGRERFLKMIAEHRGAQPNLDDQSLLHAGYWPRGRGNHYLFDLNRDWLFGVHPETRGRLREIARWNPVLFVDAHGMGPQETHLFSPPREPINPNMPSSRSRWSQQFAQEQAQAFDAWGLVYYTGEWHEEWYPGYSDGWASYRGAVGILYEQARVAADAVRRPEGRLLSYRESVLHHIIGSLANLATASANARQLLLDLHANRQAALDPKGPYGSRTFAVLPSTNRGRFETLVRMLQQQGFELYTNSQTLSVASAVDLLGRDGSPFALPAGTLLIPNRQPLGHLVAAMLEFDPRLSPKSLEEERREILGRGRSRIYDTTAWNLAMLLGLEAVMLPVDLPEGAQPLASLSVGTAAPPPSPAAVAYVFDGADDRCLAAAARLLEQGVQVRSTDKPFQLDGRAFARGSVVVTRLDNRKPGEDVATAVAQAAEDTGLAVHAVVSGLGPGDLPDLGGQHFRRLEPIRVATLGRDDISSVDYGAIWFVLDHRLGIRHSQLDASRPGDLTRYNVLIVPERWSGDAAPQLAALKDWVKAGGTLIAIGSSAAAFTPEKAEFSKVRTLPETLGRLADYELTVLREWLGRAGALPGADRVWSHQVAPQLEYPWPVDGPHPDEKELKRRDAWLSLFMPQGAMLASRIDTNHWLTAGCPEPLPLLTGNGPVLMAADGVEAPIRYGYLTATSSPPSTLTASAPAAAPGSSGNSRSEAEGKEKKKEAPRVGWCVLPPGTQMHLRMSGLLWPEAGHRLANAAWVTRERLGRGQIILFATPPAFRAAAHGSTRVLLNAVVYGPGWGTSPNVRP